MGDLPSLLPIPMGPVAAVIAHPDDESFGLGALLSGLASEGRELRVLCFTHGEASTIGATERLGDIRRRELLEAAQVLGVAHVTLLDLPDGGLDALPDAELDQHIDDWLSPDTVSLMVLEPQGVTGHPDHRAATRAAERIADRRGLAVIEWGIDPLTASRLAAEHGLRFEAIGDGPGVLDLRVDRTIQLAAISRHGSQLDDDPVVCKRLAMHGDVERVRIHQPLGVADLGPGITAAAFALTRRGLTVATGAMSSVVSGPVGEVFAGMADAFQAAADGGLVLVATVSNACPVG